MIQFESEVITAEVPQFGSKGDYTKPLEARNYMSKGSYQLYASIGVGWGAPSCQVTHRESASATNHRQHSICENSAK